MEDFVTLEIAKKLKKKGFDYPCVGHYVNNQLYIAHYQNAFHSDKDESFDASTISQVMKWLRDEKGIHIAIDFFVDIDTNEIYWHYSVKDIKDELNYTSYVYSGKESYEETAMAGIEWVLDNILV